MFNRKIMKPSVQLFFFGIKVLLSDKKYLKSNFIIMSLFWEIFKGILSTKFKRLCTVFLN